MLSGWEFKCRSWSGSRFIYPRARATISRFALFPVNVTICIVLLSLNEQLKVTRSSSSPSSWILSSVLLVGMIHVLILHIISTRNKSMSCSILFWLFFRNRTCTRLILRSRTQSPYWKCTKTGNMLGAAKEDRLWTAFCKITRQIHAWNIATIISVLVWFNWKKR